MRACSQCNQNLEDSCFYERKRGGKQAICISCRKKLNKINYQKNKDRVTKNKEKRLERNRSFIANVLKSGCVDCGIKDIRVLEFDHLKDKMIGIAQMRSHSLERIKEEIDKCEVVCANCHNIRTSQRRNDWRTKVYLEEMGDGDEFSSGA